MAVKDRPLFRRILEFDDLMRRKRNVNATSLADAVEDVDEDRAALRRASCATRWTPRSSSTASAGSFRYSDPAWHLPWIPVEGPGLFAIGVASKVLQLYEGTPVAEGLREAFQRLSDVMPPEIRVSPGAFVERLYIHPQPIRLVDPAVWNAVATAIRETDGPEGPLPEAGGRDEHAAARPVRPRPRGGRLARRGAGPRRRPADGQDVLRRAHPATPRSGPSSSPSRATST